MRCNKCGAPSRVLYTSDLKDQFLVRRRRECDNQHRFVSYEVHTQVFAELGANKAKYITNRFKTWVDRYKRDLHVWTSRKAGEAFKSIADRIGQPHSSIRSMYLRIERSRKNAVR